MWTTPHSCNLLPVDLLGHAKHPSRRLTHLAAVYGSGFQSFDGSSEIESTSNALFPPAHASSIYLSASQSDSEHTHLATICHRLASTGQLYPIVVPSCRVWHRPRTYPAAAPDAGAPNSVLDGYVDVCSSATACSQQEQRCQVSPPFTASHN